MCMHGWGNLKTYFSDKPMPFDLWVQVAVQFLCGAGTELIARGLQVRL